MCSTFSKKTALILCSLLFLAFGASVSQAALSESKFTSNLQDLVLQGNDLLATMDGVSITSSNMGSELSSLETSVNDYLDNVMAEYDDVVANAGTTMSLNSDMLVALQNLAAISASLGEELVRIAGEVVETAPYTVLSTLNSSLYAMLRLSDDIGVMADRILEMADKILVMADNIGTMADRILATQIIQNNNIELVVEATLQTQQNMIMLFGMYF